MWLQFNYVIIWHVCFPNLQRISVLFKYQLPLLHSLTPLRNTWPSHEENKSIWSWVNYLLMYFQNSWLGRWLFWVKAQELFLPALNYWPNKEKILPSVQILITSIQLGFNKYIKDVLLMIDPRTMADSYFHQTFKQTSDSKNRRFISRRWSEVLPLEWYCLAKNRQIDSKKIEKCSKYPFIHKVHSLLPV